MVNAFHSFAYIDRHYMSHVPRRPLSGCPMMRSYQSSICINDKCKHDGRCFFACKTTRRVLCRVEELCYLVRLHRDYGETAVTLLRERFSCIFKIVVQSRPDILGGLLSQSLLMGLLFTISVSGERKSAPESGSDQR